MKKVVLLFTIVMLLSGCRDGTGGNDLSQDQETENVTEALASENPYGKQEADFSIAEQKIKELRQGYPNMGAGLIEQMGTLYELWVRFDSAKRNDIDPSGDFLRSDYLAGLKSFLASRDGLTVSINDLAHMLGQSSMKAMEKTIMYEGRDYHIRVIAYHPNYYVQAITDIADTSDKWAFVQLWNEDAFYFTTLSDGDIHAVSDFAPMITEHKLGIVLMGKSWTSWPQPSFLWAWRFREETFEADSLFAYITGETDEYEAFETLRFDEAVPRKWTFHTDGSLLLVERRSGAAESGTWPSDYLGMDCEAGDNAVDFTFTSIDGDGNDESVIRLVWEKGGFVVDEKSK